MNCTARQDPSGPVLGPKILLVSPSGAIADINVVPPYQFSSMPRQYRVIYVKDQQALAEHWLTHAQAQAQAQAQHWFVHAQA